MNFNNKNFTNYTNQPGESSMKRNKFDTDGELPTIPNFGSGTFLNVDETLNLFYNFPSEEDLNIMEDMIIIPDIITPTHTRKVHDNADHLINFKDESYDLSMFKAYPENATSILQSTAPDLNFLICNSQSTIHTARSLQHRAADRGGILQEADTPVDELCLEHVASTAPNTVNLSTVMDLSMHEATILNTHIPNIGRNILTDESLMVDCQTYTDQFPAPSFASYTNSNMMAATPIEFHHGQFKPHTSPKNRVRFQGADVGSVATVPCTFFHPVIWGVMEHEEASSTTTSSLPISEISFKISPDVQRRETSSTDTERSLSLGECMPHTIMIGEGSTGAWGNTQTLPLSKISLYDPDGVDITSSLPLIKAIGPRKFSKGAPQVAERVMDTVQAEWNACDDFDHFGITKIRTQNKKRRRKAVDQVKFRPVSIFTALGKKVDKKYEDVIPPTSCFGLLNMRQQRAWSRRCPIAMKQGSTKSTQG
ncbi:hypothetical protein BABINDRAFT_89103 [Babjeviella inositovora NRRL Y-12698]|uniref:Uncharacterized protein n=1 Tax=Babjeviella inositovora NRRL Y-12698 TaxID=984486 RepID=A0A1E3QLA9_9ASCO|nr:uncharacterized protein BABINDRAFT_89103 [Babjeviella inositovora NRRL Y-12698]ODQ78254.1 hypothetical protein BABINDRAFT_89103 [Babjeviella inositovora NRRL Y-12698]